MTKTSKEIIIELTYDNQAIEAYKNERFDEIDKLTSNGGVATYKFDGVDRANSFLFGIQECCRVFDADALLSSNDVKSESKWLLVSEFE